jgi:pyruvate/2-oxoglutarate dehydrogenase complex dihydrolipoamide acyltransferase (E2) component
VTEIRLPKTGDAVGDGTLVEWLVADGERVEKGTPLYILETDKVEMEIYSPCSGVFSLLAAAEEVYPVGELLATIAEAE